LVESSVVRVCAAKPYADVWVIEANAPQVLIHLSNHVGHYDAEQITDAVLDVGVAKIESVVDHGFTFVERQYVAAYVIIVMPTELDSGLVHDGLTWFDSFVRCGH
jgi:hypothetical protein